MLLEPSKAKSGTTAVNFQPGVTQIFDLECDMWPTITYSHHPNFTTTHEGEGVVAYRHLSLNVEKGNQGENEGEFDNMKNKLEGVKNNIKEKYKLRQVVDDMTYAAQKGDIVKGNLKAFSAIPAGSSFKKGDVLPIDAQGDNIEVIINTARILSCVLT